MRPRLDWDMGFGTGARDEILLGGGCIGICAAAGVTGVELLRFGGAAGGVGTWAVGGDAAGALWDETNVQRR